MLSHRCLGNVGGNAMKEFCIERRIATRCHIDDLPAKRAIHAQDGSGMWFYAKTSKCPKKRGEHNATWLGNELIYYCVASYSDLKMPHSCILDVEDELVWGSEDQFGREAIRKSEAEGGLELADICNTSLAETRSLARALLLDLGLLNSDRQPWNILISGSGQQKELWFFDHDKSLLGEIGRA